MGRDQPRRWTEGVQDSDIFREVRAVFGEDEASALLRMFRHDLAAQLAWIARAQPETAALRDVAHRTAGRAGLLGFRALADASGDLDEATRRNRGISAALARWTLQARHAVDDPSGQTDTPGAQTQG